MSVERAARHYDRVTEAWVRWIMGEELHFGLFESGRETLPEATRKLTEALAGRAALAPGLSVLDAGCGVGTQAIALAERGCAVTGISTSEVGLARAREHAASRGVLDRARFELRDATASGLPGASFDRVLALESAHLMDKDALFRECFRVMKPGGRLALCDVVLVGDEGTELAGYAMLGHSSAASARMRAAVHATMHRAFGSEVLTHTSVYEEAARAAGFTDVAVEDISAGTRRTLAVWADNAARNHDVLVEALGPSYAEDLYLALLHMSFGWGQLGGYIVLTGSR